MSDSFARLRACPFPRSPATGWVSLPSHGQEGFTTEITELTEKNRAMLLRGLCDLCGLCDFCGESSSRLFASAIRAGIARIEGGLNERHVGEGIVLYHRYHAGDVHKAGSADFDAGWRVAAIGSHKVNTSPRGPSMRAPQADSVSRYQKPTSKNEQSPTTSQLK